ncbi:MAG: LysM peptidoglycan-binding domain-containing protein [Chloroflexi bacterium]|nr:LysM peptidoglycan-binding domain-containing protein [Chloroflexota bacterium]
MRKYLSLALAIAFLLLIISLFLPKATSAQTSAPTPEEIIQAVNALRISNGLHPLNTHPALVQVAQWEANAIAGGAPGHTRPNGLTLGQWLISLGYPLAGDLSLDGYRSENWVAAKTAEEAIQFWLGDGPHTNTMLSPDRSDIGAAVAVSDQIYIVIETALQTANGEMQTDAETILPAEDGASQNSLLPQYIMPVILSTARPDGDVLHKVQYGQSLWSIATAYHTTIEQIRAWNNLGDDVSLTEGYLLLVQKGATQPAPPSLTPTASATNLAKPSTITPTIKVIVPEITATTTPSILSQEDKPETKSSKVWMMGFLLILIIGGILSAFLLRSPKQS